LWIKQKKAKLSAEAEEFVDVLKHLFPDHDKCSIRQGNNK
jgi:hypothetical protein